MKLLAYTVLILTLAQENVNFYQGSAASLLQQKVKERLTILDFTDNDICYYVCMKDLLNRWTDFHLD